MPEFRGAKVIEWEQQISSSNGGTSMASERKSSDKQNEGERRGPNPSRREIRVDTVWHPLSFGRPPLFCGHQCYLDTKNIHQL